MVLMRGLIDSTNECKCMLAMPNSSYFVEDSFQDMIFNNFCSYIFINKVFKTHGILYIDTP